MIYAAIMENGQTVSNRVALRAPWIAVSAGFQYTEALTFKATSTITLAAQVHLDWYGRSIPVGLALSTKAMPGDTVHIQGINLDFLEQEPIREGAAAAARRRLADAERTLTQKTQDWLNRGDWTDIKVEGGDK